MTAVLLLVGAAVIFILGVWLGERRPVKSIIRRCSRRHRCYLYRRAAAKDWTGEITHDMQEQLNERERNRADAAGDEE